MPCKPEVAGQVGFPASLGILSVDPSGALVI